MKAALLNSHDVVENVIMWDETCSIDVDYVLIEDSSPIGIGYTRNEDGTFTAPMPVEIDYPYNVRRACEYPPMADYLDGIVKGDQAQVQAYIDACLAVKAKYPKPSES